MVNCPHCSRENPDGTIICIYCGQIVDEAALQREGKTRNFGETDTGENQPRWGTARFEDNTQLVLHLSDSSEILRVNVNRSAGTIIGRPDPDTGRTPEIDLSRYNAGELGVSREHARLTVHEESLYITDLESANSTYLNGLRLMPNQPRILRDSDELRLGRLKLRVTFANIPSDR